MKRKNLWVMVGGVQENYSSEMVRVAAAAAEVELLPLQNISHHKGLEAISILLLACHEVHSVRLSIPHHQDQEL
jgi:hypothetical protein